VRSERTATIMAVIPTESGDPVFQSLAIHTNALEIGGTRQ
jgi:hypothetical protein